LRGKHHLQIGATPRTHEKFKEMTPVEQFQFNARLEHARVTPWMHAHGIPAVKVEGAFDAKPSAFQTALRSKFRTPDDVMDALGLDRNLLRQAARDNIPSQWQGGFSKMTQPGSDSFADKYGADFENPATLGFEPAANKDEELDDPEQKAVEGVDAEREGAERLYNHLMDCGMSHDDAANACQIAYGGQMSEDGLYSKAEPNQAGTQGKTEYSRAIENPDWYTGTNNAYDPEGNARSGVPAQDDPLEFPGMPRTGGTMVRQARDAARRLARDNSQGMSDYVKPTESLHAYDVRIRNAQGYFNRQGRVGTFTKAKRQLAADKAITSRGKADTFARCPGLARIGRV
jgi:hypothetical protein